MLHLHNNQACLRVRALSLVDEGQNLFRTVFSLLFQECYEARDELLLFDPLQYLFLVSWSLPHLSLHVIFVYPHRHR